MGNLLMKKIHIVLSALVCLIAISCENGFPTQSKVSVPSDHNDNKDGVMHKSGARYPYSYDSNWQSSCAGSSCHKSDLRGGLVKLDGEFHTTPSCYQCHGKFWHQIDTNVTTIQGIK